MENRVNISSDVQKHVQAYLDYVNITGDTGDNLMSEKEFEDFKKNMKANSKNRVYTNWINPDGLECKVIGPSSKCFCDHRYKEHNYMDGIAKKLHCKSNKCKCPTFNYIPIYGSQDFKCQCKHSYTDHDCSSKKCLKCKCLNFFCSLSCSCGYKYNEHHTIFETREDRIKKGKNVDNLNENAPMSMGGITNFSSLADGSDKYEFAINKFEKERALGYEPNKMIEGDEESKGNNKIQKFAGGPDKKLNFCSALELFNTPHIYSSVKAIDNKKFIPGKYLKNK